MNVQRFFISIKSYFTAVRKKLHLIVVTALLSLSAFSQNNNQFLIETKNTKPTGPDNDKVLSGQFLMDIGETLAAINTAFTSNEYELTEE